jgi:glycosyltransferase involved in cell wall biosynthesis
VLACCDVFVLPSLKEGLPLSILEAMAGGKAVVASAVGSIAQIVSEGESGLLVPAGDARALEHALGSLVADEALRMNLGQRGQSIVSDRYHFHATVKAYRDVYEDGVLSARSRLGEAAAGSSS